MAAPPPTKIMLIRHAEKPTDSPDKSGPWDVKEDGTSGKGHSLIVAGWERAGALIGFFAPYKTVPAKSKIATPDYIYAANPKGESERPCETVTPLARWLKYTPSSPRFNLSYDIGEDEKKLADDVLQHSGSVLICWEHNNIIKIVENINEKYPISNYEAKEASVARYIQPCLGPRLRSQAKPIYLDSYSSASDARRHKGVVCEVRITAVTVICRGLRPVI
jgi:hypothetical protein